MITATYPGTFDPLTNGHLDLIRRACWIFPKLIVAVAESKRKHTLFTLEERVQMAKEAVKGFPNVEVVGFEGLLVDFISGTFVREIAMMGGDVSGFVPQNIRAALERKRIELKQTSL